MKKTDTFTQEALNCDSDECLLWPYARNDQGYPQYRRGKNILYVHRVICEAVYGPPPTSKHQAAHSCNRGKDGCVNPHHLSWKTHTENMADKKIHGTELIGEKANGAKLKEEDVRRLRLTKGTISQREAAAAFGISPVQVWRIWNNQRWNHVT